MLEGKCKVCSKKYYGWALNNPEHSICECGGKIEVSQEKKIKRNIQQLKTVASAKGIWSPFN